jgi:hypothetical protein
MADKRQDGGPAFPGRGDTFAPDGEYLGESPCSGMSLRDWFAGKAMRMFTYSFAVYQEPTKLQILEQKQLRSALARECYRMADAMLEERERHEPKTPQ